MGLKDIMLSEKYPVSKGSVLYGFVSVMFSTWHSRGDGERPVVAWSWGSRRVWRAMGWMCVWKVSTRTAVMVGRLSVLVVVVTQVMYAH